MMPILQTASSAGEALNTALTTNLTPTSLISDFTAILPWVAGVISVAFVIYEGRKLIKGFGKAKVKV